LLKEKQLLALESHIICLSEIMTFIVHVVGIIFSSVTCFASWILYI
jgi:hypothetical protein